MDQIKIIYNRRKKEQQKKQHDYVKIANEDKFGDVLKKYVIYHADDDLLTFDKFERLTRCWPRTNKDIDEWYEKYVELYDGLPRNRIRLEYYIDEIEDGEDVRDKPAKYKYISDIITHNIKNGFKTKSGLNKIVNRDKITKSFPLKKNKQYQLHTIAPYGTYVIDIMYSDKLAYLIAIEVNSRFTLAEVTNRAIKNDEGVYSKKNQKSTQNYLAALAKIVNKIRASKAGPGGARNDGLEIRHIIADGESAFLSKLAKQYYRNNNIIFHPTERQKENYLPKFIKQSDEEKNKTVPYHTSLSLVDRVIRTIRDMTYNMEIDFIKPKVMEEILRQYNEAYHSTLSKYAGFKVSPKMVHYDIDLQHMIITKMKADNWNITNQPGFMLREGTEIKVYNDNDKMNKRRSVVRPGIYTVIEFDNGKYTIKNNHGKITKVPRFKIDPV